MAVIPNPWRYLEGATGHSSGFESPSYDDSAWAEGDQAFGKNDLSYGGAIATPWPGSNDDLCARGHLTVPADATGVRLKVTIDFSGEVFVNGSSIGTVLWSDLPYKVFTLSSWNVGDNLIAVRAHADAQQNRLAVLADLVYPSTAEDWDIYAADALTGPIIATLENAKGRYVRSALNDLGEGGFVINRHAAEATADNLAEGNMVKVRIRDCGTDYIDGFFLGTDGDYTLLSPKGGTGKEDLAFKGPGPLSYLDRARMTPCAFSLESTVDTWTQLWSKAMTNPVGTALDPTDDAYLLVIGADRRIRRVRMSDQVVVATSPVLWAGSTNWAAGLSSDPSNSAILWALEAPWLAGSSANTKIRKIDISGGIATAAVSATIDLGSAIKHTAIKADATVLWLTRYDGTNTLYSRSKTTGANVGGSPFSVSYGGVVQTKANGVSVNGSELALWYSGTKRALIVSASAPTAVTRIISTRTIASFGGDWFTIGGDQFFAMDSIDADKVWLYQLTNSVPQCADASGVFHPEQQAPGALAWRVLVEITHPDRSDQPCAELSYDFTETTDSNGDAWPARTSTEEFTWRVGDQAWTDVLARLVPAGVTFDLDVNTMTLHAYIDANFGTDRTSGTFGSGKVRFENGVNIAVNSDLGRRDNRGQPATNMTVAGENGLYGAATLAGRYVREGFMQVSGPTTEAVLDAIGADELARQLLVSDALGFETLWGDPDNDAATQAAGRYIPKKHYWKGDLVRILTGAGEFDYSEADLRVYGTLITERDGGWRSAVDLGSAYKVPPPIASVPGTVNGSPGSGSSTSSSPPVPPPLTVIGDGGAIIPNVSTVIAAGATSPTPGTVELATGSADVPLLEELLTDETDTALVPHPDGVGGVVWGADAAGGTLLSILNWYDIYSDGGLVPDDSTDNTAAMIALLDTATAGWTRSAVICDTRGGIYRFGGAWLDTGAMNGQLLMGPVSTSDEQVGVMFVGHARPPFSLHGPLPSLTGGQTVFKPTRTDGSGTAAFISGGNGTWPVQNNVAVGFRDIVILCPDDPTFTAVNLQTCQGGMPTDGLFVNTVSAWVGSAVQPTHATYGVIFPQWGQSNWTPVPHVEVAGFSTGIKQGELCDTNAVVALCPVGVELGTSEHWSLLTMQQTGCATGIKVTGDHRALIRYDAEHFTAPLPSWQRNVHDLDDAGNHLYGDITWFSLDGITQVPDHIFDVSGAANAVYRELGTSVAGGVTGFATPAVVLGTAAAAGAASTAIRSDSTIAAFDATVPAAIGTTATGSAAKAARRDHVHPTGAGTPATQAVGDVAATGSGPAAAMTDHKHAITRPALDDLSDVVITSAASGDRVRYDGANFVNSALRWEPHVAYDGSVVLNGLGDPVMVEVV